MSHRERAPRRSARPAPLARVLTYSNPRVIRGFLRGYDLGLPEARRLFREMLKMLWLASSTDSLPVVLDMAAMDEMWHAFVLHTKDYAEFCDQYLGHFVHHMPDTGRRKGTVPITDAELEGLVTVVYTRLGKATARLWFDRFAKRYTPAFLEERRRLAVAKAAARNAAREASAVRQG